MRNCACGSLALATLIAVAALPGCSGGNVALERYASATLVAGKGLGDIELRTTTLQPFIARFGTGVPSLGAGDDFGFELRFPEERMSFLFVAEEACRDRVRAAARDAAMKLRHPSAFFAAFPACASTPLHSIAASSGSSIGGTFYKGRTDGGFGLFAMRADVLGALGPADDVRGLWLAGETPSGPPSDMLAYGRGIAVFIAEGDDGATKERLIATRIAIFPAR